MLDRYLIPETLISLAYRSIIVKMFIAFFFLDVNLKKSLMNKVTQARKKKDISYIIEFLCFHDSDLVAFYLKRLSRIMQTARDGSMLKFNNTLFK